MMHRRPPVLIRSQVAHRWPIFLVLLALTGCLPVANAETIPPSPAALEQTATTQPTILPTQTPLPTATLVPTRRPETPAPTPWQFTFPTPNPAPVSAWRPPLYDVPWAPGPYDHFFFARPIAADNVNWPVADYRYGGLFPGKEIIHTGIDIDAELGTPVLAAADGAVVWAGYGLYRGVYDTQDPYGLAVAIRHPFGYQGQRLYTVYAHMRKLYVTKGQVLHSGEALGEVGETGFVTGPHLHFEVRVQNNDFFNTRNPELWIAPPQGWGVLVGRITNTSGSYITNLQVVVKTADATRDWTVRTYGPEAVNNDPYYKENMVLSDLPAGDYIVWVEYLGVRYNLTVQIHPGMVTYFTFTGKYLFHTDLPPAPDFPTPAP
ncbi:MAG TPA: M23 family metallopeptidase [Anaerolineaceae bacterium]